MIFALALIGAAVGCLVALIGIGVCAALGIPPTHDLLVYGGLGALAAGELLTFLYFGFEEGML